MSISIWSHTVCGLRAGPVEVRIILFTSRGACRRQVTIRSITPAKTIEKLRSRPVGPDARTETETEASRSGTRQPRTPVASMRVVARPLLFVRMVPCAAWAYLPSLPVDVLFFLLLQIEPIRSKIQFYRLPSDEFCF